MMEQIEATVDGIFLREDEASLKTSPAAALLEKLEAAQRSGDDAELTAVLAQLNQPPSLARLMEMGYDRRACEAALAQAGGEMRQAADLLLAGGAVDLPVDLPGQPSTYPHVELDLGKATKIVLQVVELLANFL